MSEPEILPAVIPAANQRPAMVRADTDERLIEIWLHGRPETTQDV